MIDAALSGGDEVVSRLEDLFFDQQKMAKFGRLAGAEMVNQTEERFIGQHDLQRSPWLPSQRAIEQNGQTLRDTGRLLASITWIALPDGVTWGTNVVYGPFMHYGIPELNVEGREYLGMNDNDNASVLNIINRILEQDL